jgi:hypothetical protein
MRNLTSVAVILFVLSFSHAYGSSAWPAQTQNEPGSITGRITLDGKPAKGVTVIAAPSVTDRAKAIEEMFKSSSSMKATTDSEGVYKLEGVPPGKYRVNPSAPALVSASVNNAEVTVSEGATAEDVNFSLSLGGVITGRLADSEGRPVIGEPISLKPLEKGDTPSPSDIAARMFGNRIYTTDDRGVYRNIGLPPGRYHVSARKGWDMMSAFLSQHPKRVQTFIRV